MSAEILRRAAALMRERAEAAPTPPWDVRPHSYGDPANGPTHMVVENALGLISEHDYYDRWGGTSAEHIASWHPAVALAVADWLDREADEHERYVAQSIKVTTIRTAYADDRARHALTVARAYLGEQA